MGVARARVVEVHSPASGVGAGYLIGDRLVLTAGRLAAGQGPTAIRQAGTATWMPASPVWVASSGDAAALEVDHPSALMLPPDGTRWGAITGTRPVAVTGMGFPPADGPATWPRDATQLLGHVVPGEGVQLTVRATTPVGAGMTGAALFAGAELVGVLLGDTTRLRAVPLAALADDAAFVELFGGGRGLALTPVSTPASGFPMLAI